MLEGSMSEVLLEIHLRARHKERDPQGRLASVRPRRGARHHGAQRLRQEHAGQGARGPRGYEVTGGTVLFEGQDLLTLEPEIRARRGRVPGFQYPVEIPGVTNTYFLRTGLNAMRKVRGEEELDAGRLPQAGQEEDGSSSTWTPRSASAS
jgi:hypothetical protein